MTFEPWMLAAMEDEGYMDTRTGKVNRVAKILSKSPNEIIEDDEFRRACRDAGLDVETITRNELEQIERKLSRLK